MPRMDGTHSLPFNARRTWRNRWLPKPERAVPTLRGLKVIEDAAGNPVAPELIPWTAVTKIELDLWGMDIDASPLSLRRFSRRFALGGTYVSILALRAQRRAMRISLANGSLRVEEDFQTLRYVRWLAPLYALGLIYTTALPALRPQRIGFFDVPSEYLPVAWSLAVLLLGAASTFGYLLLWVNVFLFTAPFVRRATITSRGISADLTDGTKRQEEWTQLTKLRQPFDFRFANGSRLVCFPRNRRQRLLFSLVLEHCPKAISNDDSRSASSRPHHAPPRAEAWLYGCELADRPLLAVLHAKRKAPFPWLVTIGVVSAAMVWHFGRLDPPLNENPVARALLAATILGGCIAIAASERNREFSALRKIQRLRTAHRRERATRRVAGPPSRLE